VGGKTLKFETGKIGRQADGSVTLTVGECVLYSSAVAGKDPMVSRKNLSTCRGAPA
jgi:polyribonucleotide nucleotidyltransferase